MEAAHTLLASSHTLRSDVHETFFGRALLMNRVSRESRHPPSPQTMAASRDLHVAGCGTQMTWGINGPSARKTAGRVR